MSEKPKRPLSAYMLWLNNAREGIKKEFPGIRVTEIAKKGGEMWRGMKDKSEWEAKAAKMKDEYTKAVQEFEKNGGSKEPAAAKKRSKGAAKKPVKKSKKKDSEDEDDESAEESD